MKLQDEFKVQLRATEPTIGFCRELRNLTLAHNNLAIATEPQSNEKIPQYSLLQIRQAISSIGNILNAVEEHYCNSHVDFEHFFHSAEGADRLIEVIELGL